MKITTKKWTTGALVLMLATGATAIGARAQIGDDGPPPPPPPPGAPGKPPRDGARRTPQQAKQQRAQMLKKMLESVGITDAKTQDSIASFADDREIAARDLQEKMRVVRTTLRNGAATDKEIAASLTDLRSAAAAEKTRRALAEKALDAEINFSKNPHLDALLTTMGLVGDEAAVASPPPGRGGGGRAGGGRNRRGGPDGAPPPRNDAPDDE